MKCPLSFIGSSSFPSGLEVRIEDCLKEECAWWRPTTKQCAVLAMVDAVNNLWVDRRVSRMEGHSKFVKD